MTVGEKLFERLWAADWRAMDEFLQGLDADELALARAAYRDAPRREWPELHAHLPDQSDHPQYYRCEQLMALTLADTPKDVLAATYWFYAWEWNDDWEIDGVVLERIAARGKRWVVGFVAEVARGRVVGTSDLCDHLLSLIMHFDLPNPAGKLYRENWSRRLRLVPRPPARGEFHAVYARQREWSLDMEGRRIPRTPIRYLPVIERMRREPHLHQLVRDTLAAKRGMHDWDPKQEDSIQGALVTLVADGVFTREELVEDAWSILGRLDSPSTHRAAADLLLRLVDTDALAASFPLLLGCLTSVHGTVTSILLPHAIGAARDDDDLLALCEVIFARTEKRQRVDLLAALTADSALTRWSPATVAGGLRLAAEVDDLRLSAAARKALDAMPHPTQPARDAAEDGATDAGDDLDAVVLSGLWRETDRPERTAAAFTTLDGGQVVADAFTAVVYSSGAMDTSALDLLMRWARSDRAGLDSWLRAFVQRPAEGQDSFRFATALRYWTWGELGPARRRSMLDRVNHYFGARSGGRSRFPGDDSTSLEFYNVTPLDGFLALLAQESLLRAGDVPYLLSCPSRVDGTITFDDLVARVRDYAGTPCGPLDLLQTLLRLDPVPPERLSEFDGLVLPLWRDPAVEDSAAATQDGLELIRGWVRAGGVVPPRVRFDSEPPVIDPPVWPQIVSGFPPLPTALLGGFARADFVEPLMGGWWAWWRRGDLGEAALAVPWWSDLLAVVAEPARSGEDPRAVPVAELTRLPGRAGTGRHHQVVARLNAKTLERRLEGVDAAIAMVESGRWSADVHADVTVGYLGTGHLGLARSASSWHQLALAGELRAIWPTILAVLDAGAAMPRKPVGYPEVLAVARKLIPAVPDRTLPQSVHDLAAAKGNTRSHLEARALVDEAR